MPEDVSVTTDRTAIDLRKLLTYRLARLNAQLNSQAIRILKRTIGVSLTQWRVLVVLDSNGDMSSSSIVRAASLDKGQLSRTLKPMMDEGLIRSTQSQADNRIFVLSMTEKGRALYDKALPEMRARQKRLLSQLSPDECDLLFDMLDKIGLAADELDAQT